MTKIVPVFSDAFKHDPSEMSKHHFVEGYEPSAVLLDGDITVLTAPLKIGDRMSLLGMSTLPALLDAGLIDMTDRISAVDAKIESLVFKTTGGQFLNVPVGQDEDTDFGFHAMETTSFLILDDEVRVVKLGAEPRLDYKGQALTTAVPDDIYVLLGGSVQPDLGDIEVHGSIQWTAPFPEGEEPPLTLVGYVPSLSRVNLNRRPREEAPKQEAPAAPAKQRVRLEMGSYGVIVIELDDRPHVAKTVQHFVDLVNNGFYDGLIFHRIIKGFVIQGGGYDVDGTFSSTPVVEIENEARGGMKNKKFTVAMARTSAPHSAKSQFFINLEDNSFLDYTSPTVQGFGYCVFGAVVEGEDTVKRIAEVPTGRHKFQDDWPKEKVVIDRAVMIRSED